MTLVPRYSQLDRPVGPPLNTHYQLRHDGPKVRRLLYLRLLPNLLKPLTLLYLCPVHHRELQLDRSNLVVNVRDVAKELLCNVFDRQLGFEVVERKLLEGGKVEEVGEAVDGFG